MLSNIDKHMKLRAFFLHDFSRVWGHFHERGGGTIKLLSARNTIVMCVVYGKRLSVCYQIIVHLEWFDRMLMFRCQVGGKFVEQWRTTGGEFWRTLGNSLWLWVRRPWCCCCLQKSWIRVGNGFGIISVKDFISAVARPNSKLCKHLYTQSRDVCPM